MSPRRGPSPVALVTGAIVLLLAVAAAAGATRAGAGTAGNGPLALPAWASQLVLGCLVGGFVLLAYLTRFSPGARRRWARSRSWGSHLGPERPWWYTVGVYALAGLSLVAFIAVIALLAHVVKPHTAACPPSLCPRGEPAAAPPPLSTSSNLDWPPIAIGAGAALLVITALWLSARHRRTSAAVPWRDRRAEQRREAIEAVDYSLSALEAEPDPRRAVIAAYARMDRWLGEAGFGRLPWEAPFEHLDRVLSDLGATTAVGARLAELFEAAKFSQHPCAPEMKLAALGALAELRADLERAGDIPAGAVA